MKKLKTILQSNTTYIILFIFIFLYVFINTTLIKYNSELDSNTTELVGVITDLSISEDKLSFTLKSDELIHCNYYLDNNANDYSNILGKKVKLNGKLKDVNNNTIPNTFNYKEYLYNNKIYKTFTVSNILILEDENILYKIKNFIISRINTYDDGIKSYLNLFILGDKTYLADNIYTNYRVNGIWHLFAVSGMHISLIILVLDKLLKKVKLKNIIIAIILLYFMFLTNFSASVLRATVFFYIKSILDYFKIDINTKKILFLTAFIILLINPFIIFNVGFQYSFLITYSIMRESKRITGNYFIKILKISFISFIVSLPITINMNYEINLLSIFLNILYVPFISLIVFPLSIITFILPFLDNILEILIYILEFTNNFFNNLKINIILPKMPILLIMLYYLFLYLYSKFNNKKYFIIILSIILLNKILPKLDANYYVYYLDVGQGDSAILVSPYKNEVIMIDTGGSINSDYHVSNNTITFLKSLGIENINLLIISHGDADHAKETLNLFDYYKIDNIILNKGSINKLEELIIKNGNVINNYDSKYFDLKNINDYIKDNENDSSIITYIEINRYKLLFMGDAGVEVEEELIKKYNLEDIDILKVGHHGSKTSSSKKFINEINPTYSIISVGRNNMYGHPNSNVLDNLKNSKIYRTDIHGSVMFKIRKDKLVVETYIP